MNNQAEKHIPLQAPSEAGTLPPASAAADPRTAQPPDPYAAVTLPENSPLDPQTWTAFKQMARAVNLPAQALEQWRALEEARLQQAAQLQADQQLQTLEAWAHQTQDEWGASWQEEVSKAVRAADLFGGPELRQLLEETGLGNHPVIVRTFHAVAQRMSEDVTPGGVPAAQTDKTFTQALYGKN